KMGIWQPEYGQFMVESTPSQPYGSSVDDMARVEENMCNRRNMASRHLNKDESLVCITSYPMLGAGDFVDPPYLARGESSHGLFLPDEIINPHIRFRTLTANIRQRRGSKVAINVPLFFDTNTPRPFIDPTIPYKRNLFPED